MSDENMLAIEETPETLAAEEAAFAASFSEALGTDDEAVVPVAEEVEPADEPEPVESTPAEPAPEPAAPEPAAPKQLTIAGLTEDQIAAALNRNAALQGTVDKMAGRMGQLMQQIEQLRTNPPTTQSAQKAFDVKLDKLTAAFPELGRLLAEDLQGMQGAASEPAPNLPQGITQEQFDAALNERLSATTSEMREQVEVKILGIVHPDWRDVIRTPQFALYRDNVLPAGVGQQLMDSEDSSFISKHLSAFKSWRDSAAEQPAPTPPPQSQANRSRRLSNAVLPAGNAAPLQAPVTEEDGFAAGFANERKRAGR